jgi:hypothetical protein
MSRPRRLRRRVRRRETREHRGHVCDTLQCRFLHAAILGFRGEPDHPSSEPGPACCAETRARVGLRAPLCNTPRAGREPSAMPCRSTATWLTMPIQSVLSPWRASQRRARGTPGTRGRGSLRATKRRNRRGHRAASRSRACTSSPRTGGRACRRSYRATP